MRFVRSRLKTEIFARSVTASLAGQAITSGTKRNAHMVYSSLSRATLASVLFVSLGFPAIADPLGGGFYLEGFGGASSLADTGLSGTASGTSGFGTGQVFGVAVGYGYAGSPFRSELEFAYRSGDANGAAGITGDFASTTFALNGYYDFETIAGGSLKPYVGAGLAYVTEIDFDVSGGGAPGEYNARGDFGYQLMVGAEYPISDRWSVTGEVRYFDAGRQDLTGPGGTLSSDYQSVDVIIGTSIRF
jgi:opacity protein-like surface antigen